MFENINGIAADSSGFVFVTSNGCRIRQIEVATRNVTTLAGSSSCGSADGLGSLAMFDNPQGITTDQSGNVFVSEYSGCRIRHISVSTRTVSTVAGSSCGNSLDGVGTSAILSPPVTLRADSHGSLLFSEYMPCFIRKIVISSRVVSTFVGRSSCSSSIDGVGTNAAFENVWTFVADSFGSLYVSGSNSIRHVDIPTAKVSTISYAGGARSLAADLGVVYYRDVSRIFKLQAVTWCTAGFYCPASGNASRLSCDAGFYCPQGSSSGSICTVGSFCPAGASAPAACSAGLYCPTTGMSAASALFACTGGYFCSATGASAETRAGMCERGSFCPAGSSSARQQQCPAGSYCDVVGLSAPTGLCQAGFYCLAGSTNATQYPCPNVAACPAGSALPTCDLSGNTRAGCMQSNHFESGTCTSASTVLFSVLSI